jgi:hypothetical protein
MGLTQELKKLAMVDIFKEAKKNRSLYWSAILSGF